MVVSNDTVSVTKDGDVDFLALFALALAFWTNFFFRSAADDSFVVVVGFDGLLVATELLRSVTSVVSFLLLLPKSWRCE